MNTKYKKLAEKIFNSLAYKKAEVEYYTETHERNYWIAACTQCEWVGLSRDMVIKEHTEKVKQFMLQKTSPLMDIKYYTHHCPLCDGIVFNPKEAVQDPNYEFNMPPREKKDPHETSLVKCDICSHTWVAVRPLDTPKLECPNCHNICNFSNIKI